MSFLRPASPSPLQLPSSPMDGSRMDFSTTMSSPVSNANSITSAGYNFTNPHSRVIHSPTPAHMRARTRRPSSLSLGFDRIKPFGFGASSSSSPSSGGPNVGTSGMVQGSGSILQAAPVIFDPPVDLSMNAAGRGRASSSASTMSFSFSPSRRSISLEDSAQNVNQAQNGMEENEETPQATTRRKSNRLSNLTSLKRRRAVIGITGQNESESSLSNASNGRNTPDLQQARSSLDLGIGGMGMGRGIEDDVDALAMDFAGSSSGSPHKDGTGMNQTPPRGTVPLADVSPFAPSNGLLKPARLLRIQNELTAPFLDGETRSEAAFTRLVASTSDLASRLRLTNATPSSSPARIIQRKPRRWMEDWAAKTAGNTGGGLGINGNSNAAAVTANGGAGRFPESVHGDGDRPTGGSDDTDSEGDDAAEATFVISRPSSGMGHASMPISMGRSRSGSGVLGDAMMMVGSYGTSMEMGDGGMDLDMASNMSSPVSTPAAYSWREPAPFFQSKKRKFSAAVDAERQDLQPQVKKRKGMSPHGTSIPLSASSSSPFSFAQPRSPHQSFQGAQLSMTAITAASANQMSNSAYFSPFGGGPFSTASGTALGVTGISTPMGHQHRKSGSISTMAWSRPGSTHSSPLLRPTSGQGNSGPSMPAPPGMLLGPSMLSISSTAAAPSPNAPNNNNAGSFNFNFSTGRGPGGAFPQFNNVQTGEFGAPLTASPSNRPMMKLPERAAHALTAAQPREGGGTGGDGRDRTNRDMEK